MPGYELEGAKWPDVHVTWSFAASTYTADAAFPFSSVISDAYQGAIRWALQQWASVTSLIFTQVADSLDDSRAADIRIGFGRLDTPTTGVIGQANLHWTGTGSFLPDEVVRLEDPAQLGLSPGSDGNYTYSGTMATLGQVALHEIGHALGLGHASDPNAVMYPSVGANNQVLDQTDILGIQSLYGAPVPAVGTGGGGASVESDGFDASYYLRANPDVAAAGVDPAWHFHNFGWHEGRNPDALFDVKYYLSHNSDVAMAGMDPLAHYSQYGWHEGRDPSSQFSTNAYLAAYKDVAAAEVNPLVHYLQYGAAEGRSAFGP